MTTTAIYIINILLFIIPCFLLLALIFWDRQKISYVKVAIGISVYLPICFLGTVLYYMWGASTILQSLLSLTTAVIGVALFSFLMRYSIWQSIFLIILVKCYTESVNLLTYYVYFLFTRSIPEATQEPLFILAFFLTLLTFPLMYRFCSRLLKPALDCSFSLTTWRVLWVIPLLNNVIYTLIITPSAPIYTTAADSAFYFLPPLWIILTFTTFFLLARTIMSITQNLTLQQKLQLSEIQVTAQQKQNELLKSSIEETGRIRHDIRHHFLALRNLVNNQDITGLEKYFEELSASYPDRPSIIYCDNSTVNAFLCYFRDLAAHAGADMTLSIGVPETFPIPEADLCIILGNLLENAVEACKRMKSEQRFIRLKMTMSSPLTMIIIIENSYEGDIHIAPDGNYLSSKTTGRRGIGISSVLNITEKYNGIPRFEHRNNTFKVSLLLNGQKNKADKSASAP